MGKIYIKNADLRNYYVDIMPFAYLSLSITLLKKY